MDKITIRSPGGLLFAAGSGYMIYLMIQDAYWGYGFIALVGFVLSLVFAKSYTLCEKGIKHKLFGICFKVTPWNEIQDVMCVYMQTGDRYNTPTLMFTTKRGKVYRPDESGYIPKAQRKAFYKEWLCGRIFMVPYPLKKGTQRFLAIVENTTARWTTIISRIMRKPTPSRRSGGRSNGIIGNLLKMKLSSLAGPPR